MVPRYRQRMVPSPLGLGHPTWEDDPSFDIENHVFEVSLDSPATEDDLRAFAEDEFARPMDRTKPLWEIYIIRGMKHRITGMFCKVHHCMIDGIAGISLMSILFDTTPDTPKFRRQPYKPAPLPGQASRLYDALWESAIESLDHWSRFQRDLSEYSNGSDPKHVLHAVREFAATMAGFLSPIKRLPFNKAFGGKRKIAWREFSFAEARAIRNVCGGTFNDVVLAVLTGAVRRYAAHHGITPKHRDFRILVPVNLRREEERGDLGNRVTFLPVQVPLVIEDPVERLHAIHDITQNLKKEKVPEAVALMFSALQGTAAPVQSAVLSGATTATGQTFLSMLSQVPPLHMICTNVPGPQIPLYAVGKRLKNYYALVPVALEMGVTCAVTTYDQRMAVTFTADTDAAPDLDLLLAFFDEAFTALRIRADVEEKIYVELHRKQAAATKSPAKKRRARARKTKSKRKTASRD